MNDDAQLRSRSRPDPRRCPGISFAPEPPAGPLSSEDFEPDDSQAVLRVGDYLPEWGA